MAPHDLDLPTPQATDSGDEHAARGDDEQELQPVAQHPSIVAAVER